MNIAQPTDQFHWQPEDLLEISLPDPDAFLKIRETLTRIGVASKRENTLYQTASILHKRGKYYIVHFKELFLLSGKDSYMTVEDVRRRNTIAKLLQQWGLCTVVRTDLITVPINTITIIPFKEKRDWNFVQKYTMASDRRR